MNTDCCSVGLVNRGEGCARKNALGIFARVKVEEYFLKKIYKLFLGAYKMD